jgi:hypothetical protein
MTYANVKTDRTQYERHTSKTAKALARAAFDNVADLLDCFEHDESEIFDMQEQFARYDIAH